MANGGQRRTRSERVAALELPPGRWERAWLALCHRDVLSRIALAFVAAVAVVRDHPGLGSAHPLAHGHGAHALRDVAGRIQTGKEGRDRPGAAQGPRRNQGRFHPGHPTAGTVAGRLGQHDRRAHQDGNADRKDPPDVEGVPVASGKGRERVQAPGGTGRLPGVPQGTGRQGKPRQARSRGRRGLRPFGGIRLAGRPHGEAQGLTTRKPSRSTRSRNPSRPSTVAAAGHRSPRSDGRSPGDPAEAGRGTRLDGHRRPSLRLARAAASAIRRSR